jgi:adenylate cyclase
MAWSGATRGCRKTAGSNSASAFTSAMWSREADGDLMGDGVNIAARLEGVAAPGAICLSEQAYWQVKGRLDLAVTDLGQTQLKNIADPIRVYSLEVGKALHARSPQPKKRSSLAPLGVGFAALIVLVAAGV